MTATTEELKGRLESVRDLLRKAARTLRDNGDEALSQELLDEVAAIENLISKKVVSDG